MKVGRKLQLSFGQCWESGTTLTHSVGRYMPECASRIWAVAMTDLYAEGLTINGEEREEGSWTMDIDGPIEYCLFQHCKCRPSGGFCLLCKMVVMLLHCCTKHYKQDWIASKFCGQSCLIDVVNAITNLKQPCRRNPLSSNRQGPIRMTSLNSRQMTTEGETFELCRWRRLHRDGVRNFKVVWFRLFD